MSLENQEQLVRQKIRQMMFEKLRNIRKLFDPKAGAEDVASRTEIAAKQREANEAAIKKLLNNVNTITGVCSADKKDEIQKAVSCGWSSGW